MSQPAGICAACHQSRTRGNYNDAGDLFICATCQADAKQLFEIQDRIQNEAEAIINPPDHSGKPAPT